MGVLLGLGLGLLHCISDCPCDGRGQPLCKSWDLIILGHCIPIHDIIIYITLHTNTSYQCHTITSYHTNTSYHTSYHIKHTNTSYHTIALYVLHCIPIHHAYHHTIPYLSYIADLGHHHVLRSWSRWLQLLKDLRILDVAQDCLPIDEPHL